MERKNYVKKRLHNATIRGCRLTTPTQKTQEHIKLAAELRVQGESWAVVAERIGRADENSAEHLVHEHPEEWKRAYEEAYNAWLPRFEARCAKTQDELQARDGDKFKYGADLAQRAAHSGLAHTAKLKIKRFEGEIKHKIKTSADEMTHDELLAAARAAGIIGPSEEGDHDASND